MQKPKLSIWHALYSVVKECRTVYVTSSELAVERDVMLVALGSNCLSERQKVKFVHHIQTINKELEGKHLKNIDRSLKQLVSILSGPRPKALMLATSKQA